MEFLDLTIRELHNELVKKTVTPLDLVKEALLRAKADSNNAFEYIMEKEALDMAIKLKEPEADNLFWGIPFVIKDNFSTKDVPTTASSNILKDYVPVFDATVVKKLLDAKAIPIGKTTLDELAMGGSGTTGHLGTTFNPYDKQKEHLIGGSSCGSAAAVAGVARTVSEVAITSGTPVTFADLSVEGMRCEMMCGGSIKKALAALPGVVGTELKFLSLITISEPTRPY